MEISVEKTNLVTNNAKPKEQRITVSWHELKTEAFQVPSSYSQCRGCKDRSPSKCSAGNSSTGETEIHVEKQEHRSLFQAEATAGISIVNLLVCILDMDTKSRTAEEIQAVKMRCFRTQLSIPCAEHILNEEIIIIIITIIIMSVLNISRAPFPVKHVQLR